MDRTNWKLLYAGFIMAAIGSVCLDKTWYVAGIGLMLIGGCWK